MAAVRCPLLPNHHFLLHF